jgi:pimeloyl-ACP methyl ester carboxylesterase
MIVANPPTLAGQEKGMCLMSDPERRFYNDLLVDEKAFWSSELRLCPAIAQTTPITYAAYLQHPVTYIFCENDEALPIDVQHTMVEKVSKGTGISIPTESWTAGHSPYLSQPEMVLALIKKLAAGVGDSTSSE